MFRVRSTPFNSRVRLFSPPVVFLLLSLRLSYPFEVVLFIFTHLSSSISSPTFASSASSSTTISPPCVSPLSLLPLLQHRFPLKARLRSLNVMLSLLRSQPVYFPATMPDSRLLGVHQKTMLVTARTEQNWPLSFHRA